MRARLVRLLVTVALVGTVALAPLTNASAIGTVGEVGAAAAFPANPAAEEPTTTVAGDGAGIGGLDTGSNSPSPRGEPEPPRSQRVADTAIFVGLLVVFVAGVVVAVRTARRSPGGPGATATSDPVSPPAP